MKKISLLILSVLSFAVSQAQNITDGLRYSTDQNTGTARFTALSGAMGALGGDFSAIGINPAGGAVFLSSNLMVSASLFDVENNANYFNNSEKSFSDEATLNQLGGVFVINNSNEESAFKKFTIGLNYDISRSLDNQLFIAGTGNNSIGNFFFQPNEQVARDPHADAQAAAARGEYAEAVEEYRKLLESDPNDLLAYSEIAKLCCDHLEDPAAAAQTLEQALEREWPPDDAAFLTTRLVDVYWQHQRDARSARALLMQIVEAMPGTRHAANAEHRLKEIEQQLSLEG
jgi:tetratricopeptide (TPR) repeat protein